MGILNRKKQTKDTTPVDAAQKTKASDEKKDDAKTVSASPRKKHTVEGPIGKRVLLGAHVSEKAATGEENGRYTFRVALNATKIDIKHAVQAQYSVMPTKVHVSNVEGKRVRFGKYKGKRADWKKATVTLPKGKHIDIHSGV